MSSPAEPPEPSAQAVYDALRGVDDPEVGLNVVELGLVYGVDVGPGKVHVRMTMTSAACPLGEQIVEAAESAIRQALPEAADIDIELVWDPPWTPSLMTEEARNFFGWPGA